jgi:uncharacterized membrane protein YgcG
MKNIRFFTFVLILGTLVLSACGAAAATPTAAPQATRSAKVDAMPVAFVGIVDSIAGDQWVISGTTVTVDEAVVRDGPFSVGDQVKVEGLVHPDGSFTISRVESPTPQEIATLPAVSVDNSNDAISNANTNDANTNDGNINDDNSSGVNSNDDNSNTSNSNDSNANDDSGNSNDDNSNSSNDNGDDNGGDRGNDNDDDDGSNDNGDDSGGGSSNDDSGNDDNSGRGGGDDDSGGDDNGSGGGGSDD